MGLPVTIYRYTDAGAPQLTNGTPSEWINILKKVLVEGYGSKVPLGWTLEFENAGAFKVAFRNSLANGGSGGYVQFSSATGTNAANTALNIQSAASMSAIDSFIKPGYVRGLASVGIRGWEIIGTSRGFYIIGHYTTSLTNGISLSATNYPNQYFVGDIESYTPNDAGVFTIASATNAQNDESNSTGLAGNNNDVFARLYATDGGNTSYMYSASKTFPISSTSVDGNAESLGLNHQMIPLIFTGNYSTMNTSTTSPYCRGQLPGLHSSSFAGYRTENWPKELTQGGVTFVLLRAYISTRLWVKTGTWYD